MSRAIDLRAAEFDRANPHVMEELRRLALVAVNHGRRRLSINELFEVLRYQHGIRTGGDEFKLNNNYRAWYSRRLMETTPRLVGLFEIRGGASAGIADGLVASMPDPVPNAVDDTDDGAEWWEADAA